MANSCFNRVSVWSENKTEVAEFVAAITGPHNPIDFNVITPIPDILNNVCEGLHHFEIDGRIEKFRRWYKSGVGADARPLSNPELEELDDLGATDIADWKVKNWGCNWNAYNCDLQHSGNIAVYTFETPWSPPETIIWELREIYPHLVIEAFFDEPLNQAAGYY